ncbi:hypothetical protein C8Q75DRAFT_619044 [Abortiporus biennis]|nr:hypothetical protein C8Q75DRAFT_619044 [Abortiporus biennis]
MLREILLRMPNLESLHLRHVSLHQENGKDTYGRKQPLGPKKSLTTLSLEDDGTSSDMMNILDILDLFSEIENLSIREIWSNSDGWNHRSIARHGGNFFLRLLYVPSRNVATVNSVVTQRIFWLPNGHSVRSLSLMREDSAESMALGDSVCLQGADLKHLEIKFSDSLMRHGKPLWSEWSNKLRFQTLSNLESISFWCTTPDDFCTGFLILPLLSTATLHNITFLFSHFAGKSHSITMIEWPKFQDRLLCFSSLRTITIAFERDEIQDTIYGSWHEVIRSNWPLLHDKGLLRFETAS